MNNPPIVYRFL